MHRGQIIIIGVTVVALSALVVNFTANTSTSKPKEHQASPEPGAATDSFFLPATNEDARYRESDLDMLFVGAIALEGQNDDPKLKNRTYASFFENYKRLLTASDLVIGGLTSTLVPAPVTDPSKRWSGLKETVEVLNSHNFSAVSLAHPALLDFGEQGLSSTAQALASNGIDWFGAAPLGEPSSEPLIIERRTGSKTVKLTLIGAAQQAPAQSHPNQPNRDLLRIVPLQPDAITAQIKQIRAKDNQTIIIVFPSWGRQYSWKSSTQNHTARVWVDAGADYVIGYGTHMMQQVEKYNDKWILFGLGDFVSNDPNEYKKGSHNPVPLGLIARLTFREEANKLTRRLRIYPINIDNVANGYRGHFANAREFNTAYWRLITEEWQKDDRWLKRQAGVGKDSFGRYLQLGKDSDN